jgi:hypothetical protein
MERGVTLGIAGFKPPALDQPHQGVLVIPYKADYLGQFERKSRGNL